MIEEDELQRRELARLLSTAKDEDRKDVIRKAMSALDTHETTISTEQNDRFNVHALNPSIHASIYMGQSMPMVESMSSARLRPMSARRRPSVTNLLDAIPEVSLHSTKNSPGVGTEEMVLPYDDISEVVCSSFDAKYPAKNIFKSQSSSSSSLSSPTHPSFNPLHHSQPSSSSSSSSPPHHIHHIHSTLSRGNSKSHLTMKRPVPANGSALWMSTGMLPQFIVVTFYEKWLIKKLEVCCRGVEAMAVHINFSASSSFSSAKLLDMKKISDDRFMVEVISRTSSSNNLSGLSSSNRDDFLSGGETGEIGVNGIGLTIVIQKTTAFFCGLHNVKIFVSPHT